LNSYITLIAVVIIEVDIVLNPHDSADDFGEFVIEAGPVFFRRSLAGDFPSEIIIIDPR